MGMLDELATYCAANGIGTAGTNLFVAHSPATPDNTVVLNELRGDAPVRTMAGQAHECRRVQAMVRNTSHVNGEAKAAAVKALLDFYKGTLGTSRYVGIKAEHEPFALGVDENNRYRWTVTFEVWRQPA